MASSANPGPERAPGIGSRLRAAGERLLGFWQDHQSASLPRAAAEAAVPGDELVVAGEEVVVVEEWVQSAEGDEGAVFGWHGSPVLGWYRTEAAEGRDPTVGPTPRPGGPKPGSPRPGGPRPGVRPSGPPLDIE